ncbi:MAG: hypothetical protein HY690_01160 [Chloroflexi bacterium]|nr:hypothetical protein [Chloroflexota bacterium]
MTPTMIRGAAGWAIITLVMSDQPSSYPVDARGFVQQCAWCSLVADERGRYVLPAPGLLQGWSVTHGCCDSCRRRLEAAMERRRQARCTLASC